MTLRTSLLCASAALALTAGHPFPSYADASHSRHPMENGTAAAPLDIVRMPTDVASPIGRRGPTTVRITLETVEVTGRLADGATYHYWTFSKRVPGPFIRARVGDTVEVQF